MMIVKDKQVNDDQCNIDVDDTLMNCVGLDNHENINSTTQRIINPTRTITTATGGATEINNPAGVGCPVVEQESVEQPLVSKNVGGGGQYFDINIIIIIIIASS